MIIGTPKSLEEFRVFSRPEVDELINGAESLATSGAPLELPSTVMTVTQVSRIALTVKHYHQVAQNLVEAVLNSENEDEAETTAKVMCVVAEAEALLNIEPPKEQKVVVPKGRIVLPK